MKTHIDLKFRISQDDDGVNRFTEEGVKCLIRERKVLLSSTTGILCRAGDEKIIGQFET